MKIIVLNGPNLNLLGVREPLLYGTTKFDELVDMILQYGNKLGIKVAHFQSNSEGDIIDRIHSAIGEYDGIILNAGAYTHYSYAIRDAIASVEIPVIEVHISNIYKREEFRQKSVIAPVCLGQISGLGIEGYRLAIDFFYRYFNSNNK